MPEDLSATKRLIGPRKRLVRQELEDAATKAGKIAHETVMTDCEEYMELVFEVEELLVGLSSKMEMVMGKMDFII